MCDQVNTFNDAWACLKDTPELFYQTYPELKPFDNGAHFFDFSLQEDGTASDNEMQELGATLSIGENQCIGMTPDECKIELAKNYLAQILQEKPKTVACAYVLGSYPYSLYDWEKSLVKPLGCEEFVPKPVPMPMRQGGGGTNHVPHMPRF